MQKDGISYLKDSRFWLILLFTGILLTTMIVAVGVS